MADQARSNTGPVSVAAQLGEGGELRTPLAAVIISMFSSTILTLVFVPVSYTYFDGLQRRILGLRLPGSVRRRAAALARTNGAAAHAADGLRPTPSGGCRPAPVGAEHDGNGSTDAEPARRADAPTPSGRGSG